MKTVPDREEIRRRYEIKEADFGIRLVTVFPDPQHLLRDGAMMEKKGFWGNFEVWIEKTIVGDTLMAVIFIATGSFARGLETIGKYGYIVYANRQQVMKYVRHFVDYTREKATGFLVHTVGAPTAEDRQFQHWAIFPTGSLVYPISGDWTLG